MSGQLLKTLHILVCVITILIRFLSLVELKEFTSNSILSNGVLEFCVKNGEKYLTFTSMEGNENSVNLFVKEMYQSKFKIPIKILVV